MNWYQGYKATYYARYVDPNTWRALDRFEITSGSINKSNDSLRESAEVKATEFDQSKERWIRLYLDASQNGDVVHEPLFTGLATSPSRTIDGMIEERNINVYSVLKPVEDILLPRGWFAPARVEGAQIVMELLAATPAPVRKEKESPLLKSSIVAEDGETNLTMIDKILNAINWRLIIDGNGEILLAQKPQTASIILSQESNMAIEPQISMSRDWFGCPNVFRAVTDNLIAIAEDNSNSDLSINGRGRRVEVEEINAVTAENESLLDYAERRLKEEQRTQEIASYNRRYLPNINVGDIINYHYEQINGDYIVTSQRISLDFNANTSEEVMRYVSY